MLLRLKVETSQNINVMLVNLDFGFWQLWLKKSNFLTSPNRDSRVFGFRVKRLLAAMAAASEVIERRVLKHSLSKKEVSS